MRLDLIRLTPSPRFSASSSKVSPRFGRDAWFERNDRFETRPLDPQKVATLETVIAKPVPRLNAEKLKLATDIAQASAFLYEPGGKIRGRVSLQHALAAAEAEVKALGNIKGHEKAMAEIKLANARIASNKDLNNAFALLNSAFKTLDDMGYQFEAGKTPDTYVHGRYNLGAFVFNNDVYFCAEDECGPANMARADVDQ